MTVGCWVCLRPEGESYWYSRTESAGSYRLKLVFADTNCKNYHYQDYDSGDVHKDTCRRDIGSCLASFFKSL